MSNIFEYLHLPNVEYELEEKEIAELLREKESNKEKITLHCLKIANKQIDLFIKNLIIKDSLYPTNESIYETAILKVVEVIESYDNSFEKSLSKVIEESVDAILQIKMALLTVMEKIKEKNAIENVVGLAERIYSTEIESDEFPKETLCYGDIISEENIQPSFI